MALVTSYWILDIVALIFSAVGALYAYFKLWSSKHWARRKIPYVEPKFMVGNTGEANVTKTLSEVFDDLYLKHKDKKLLGVFTYIRPALLIFDVEIIKRILVNDFSNFHDRGLTINEKLEPLTAHLFNMSGQQWRNLRVKLTPTFTSGKMKMMYETMYNEGINLQNYLEKKAGTTMEIKNVVACYTTDVISSCAFGIESRTLENPESEFRKYGKMVFDPPLEIMISAIIQFVAPWAAKFLPLRQMPKVVSDFFLKVILDVISHRETTDTKRKDFLELLIELKQKGRIEDADTKYDTAADDGDPFTLEQAAAQAFVFFFAGFETSSTAIMWALYEMALNPDIQEKLQSEIDEVLKKEDGKISYNAIMGMQYLEQVFQESLRKYSPVPLLFRECTKDYTVEEIGVELMKGDFIMIPINAVHHDPDVFSNPEKFDPDRFSPERANENSFSHLAFGSGPRICIGARFGTLQAKVGLIMMLSKFNVEVCEETPIPPVLDPTSFVPYPKAGIKLKITKRN